MEDAFDNTRREALWKLAKGLLAGVGEWTSGAVTGAVGTIVASEAIPYTKGAFHEKVVATFGPCGSVKDIFADLFLGTREKVSIIPAQDNPNVKPDSTLLATDPYEIFTHTTLSVARTFAGVLDQVENRIRRTDQLLAVNGEGNLVTFGSPTSNLFARMALRYEKIGDGTSGSKHHPTDAFHLPFLYELDGDEILRDKSAHRACYRTVNGKTIEIPNWGVRKATGALLLPETDNGVLTQDYLIISNLPNVFNKYSFEAGHRLINFGGTHREGTSAVQYLFTNEDLLQNLCKYVQTAKGTKADDPYWQALILVNCNAKDNSVRLSHILDFKKVEVHTHKLEQLVHKNHERFQRYHLE